MKKREPDFDIFKQVLERKVPERPVLYNLFFGEKYYSRFSGTVLDGDIFSANLRAVELFSELGYDYANVASTAFRFPREAPKGKQTYSLNAGSAITDWESFEKYTWLNPDDFSSDGLDKIKPYLPGNMKLMVVGPMGVLENLIALM